MKPCHECGERPRISSTVSKCYPCWARYVRLWRAKKAHGPNMEGYKPQPFRHKWDKPAPPPKVRLRATPTAAELRRL